MCSPPAATPARHFLGIEQIRLGILTYVSLSILPVILLPVADISVAADDAFLPCYLTDSTDVQLDSNRMKTQYMETCRCFVDGRRQSLDGQSEVAHYPTDPE